MNKYITKANDFYLKQLRQCQSVRYFEHNQEFWITNGYVVHKINPKYMELNPFNIRQCTDDVKKGILDILKTDNMVVARDSGIIKKYGVTNMKAYIIDGIDQLIWFNNNLIKLFPDYSTIYVTEPLSPAIVKRDDEVLGIILPVRAIETKDIKLFL